MSQPTQPETDLIGVLTAIFSSNYSDTKVGWQEMARFTLEYLSANGYTITPKARSTPAGAPQAPDRKPLRGSCNSIRLDGKPGPVIEWREEDGGFIVSTEGRDLLTASRGSRAVDGGPLTGEEWRDCAFAMASMLLKVDERTAAAPTLPGSSTAPDLREILHPFIFNLAFQFLNRDDALKRTERTLDRICEELAAPGSSTEAGGQSHNLAIIEDALKRCPPPKDRSKSDPKIALEALAHVRKALAGPQYHGNDLEALKAADALADQIDRMNNPERASDLANPTDEYGMFIGLFSEYRRLRAQGGDAGDAK